VPGERKALAGGEIFVWTKSFHDWEEYIKGRKLQPVRVFYVGLALGRLARRVACPLRRGWGGVLNGVGCGLLRHKGWHGRCQEISFIHQQSPMTDSPPRGKMADEAADHRFAGGKRAWHLLNVRWQIHWGFNAGSLLNAAAIGQHVIIPGWCRGVGV